MEKNKIFSKLNIRDYNNELEKILEKKILYTLDVKNLLLSMLYKVENAFSDYQTVKVEVPSKKEFIEHILATIEQKCIEIEVVKPITEDDIELEQKEKAQAQLLLEEKQKNYILDKENGKIICYQNELSLLEAICDMGLEKNRVLALYSYCQNAIDEMLVRGKILNQEEVIRDFNGWSWDTTIEDPSDMQYQLLFQSLLLLEGEHFSSIKKFPLLERKVNQLALAIYVNQYPEERTKMANILEEKEESLKLFQDKKKFIQTVTDYKKECNKKIEYIDRILNDTILLKKEYQERNSKLPNKEKIFSISHLVDKLDKERKELLNQMQEYNRMIGPKEFVKEKQKIEEEVQFLKQVFDPKKEKEGYIELCQIFLQCVEKSILPLEDRSNIISWLYKIRYYHFLPMNQTDTLKDIESLKESFKVVIKLLIKKAYSCKLLDEFTEQEDLTYMVLKEIFSTKLINLDHIYIECMYEKPKLTIQYYDTDVLEFTVQIEQENVRIKRKFQLFI